MKHTSISRIAAMTVLAVMFAVSVQQSFAAGTLAGTTINNTANVQYNAGSNVRTGTSNTVTMTVGYKVSINILASSSSTTTPDSTILYKPFYFFNSGNFGDNFKMTVANLPAGWSGQLYKDQNGNGTYESGTDSAITSGSAIYTDTTIANRVKLILKVTIPQGAQAADAQSAAITVGVESDGSGPGGVVRVGGVGTQTYTANVLISKPVISVSGAQTVTPANAIPGASYTYRLTLQNTGTGEIQNGAALTFKLDNDFNFTSATNSGAISGQDINTNGGTVTWTVNQADIPAGGASTTRDVVVTIEQITTLGTGAPYNSLVTIMDSTNSTTTQLVYNDGLHNYTKGTAALASFNVARAAGAKVLQVTANQNGNPGDSVTYVLKVVNRGNSANTFTMSQVINGGILDTTHLFTETSGTTGTQPRVTSSIAAGDTLVVYAYLIVNVTGVDGNTIIRNLTATAVTAGSTPLGVGNYVPTITVTTTVTSPNLNIALSQAWVSGVGTLANPAPGDTIEYTLIITNNGTGTATNLTTSNAIPTNTTFGPNSYGASKGISVDGVAKTNANDVETDAAYYNASTVYAGPFNIISTGTKTVKYKVAVN